MIEIDVEMPKSCSECFAEYDYINCQITDKHLHYTDFTEKRMEGCPLMEKMTGYWTKKFYQNNPFFACTNCGWTIHILDERKYNFCPNCGADMRKGDI